VTDVRISSRSLLLAVVLLTLSATTAIGAAPSWPNTNPSADAKVRETFVSIPAGDHVIPGILALPRAGGAARSYPAVLMLHGFASQKDEVGDMYLREARSLAQRGVASLRIDFAGTGDSQQPYTANTWTGMVADAVTAYDWLVANARVIDDRVGVLGFSMGSKVGLGLIAERPGVAAFASWSGALYDGIPDGYIGLYADALANGSVVLDLGFAVVELSLAWFDTMIASTPLTDAAGYQGSVLAVAGSEDTTVDPSVSQAFLATLNSPDETLQIIQGADHIYHVLTPDQTLAEAAITITADWFADRL
jgi:dienelactone hydrolase